MTKYIKPYDELIEDFGTAGLSIRKDHFPMILVIPDPDLSCECYLTMRDANNCSRFEYLGSCCLMSHESTARVIYSFFIYAFQETNDWYQRFKELAVYGGSRLPVRIRKKMASVSPEWILAGDTEVARWLWTVIEYSDNGPFVEDVFKVEHRFAHVRPTDEGQEECHLYVAREILNPFLPSIEAIENCPWMHEDSYVSVETLDNQGDAPGDSSGGDEQSPQSVDQPTNEGATINHAQAVKDLADLRFRVSDALYYATGDEHTSKGYKNLKKQQAALKLQTKKERIVFVQPDKNGDGEYRLEPSKFSDIELRAVIDRLRSDSKL